MDNWTLILEIVGVIGGIATIIALMLGPMFYLGSKIESMRAEIRGEMQEFRNDMQEFRYETKDFHRRLCEIEAGNKK